MLEEKIPEKLQALQTWFAHLITQPFDSSERISSITASGIPIAQEAAQHLLPSPTLAPYERIQIYHQQYWWRLLRILSRHYPLLERVIGELSFRFDIAVPYLIDCPPNHWSLELLGERLPAWLRTKKEAWLADIASVDWAFTHTVIAATLPPLDLSTVQSARMLILPLYLQPFVTPFLLPYDLFAFRQKILEKEPSFWKNNPFPKPPRDKECYTFVFYRGAGHNLFREEIDSLPFAMLMRFRKGATLEQLCEECDSPEISQHLQNFTSRGWLTKYSHHKLLTTQSG